MKTKMSLEEFKKLAKGINDGMDLPIYNLLRKFISKLKQNLYVLYLNQDKLFKRIFLD